jgi:ribonuclease D
VAEHQASISFLYVTQQDDLAAVCGAVARVGEVAVDSESNALYAYQERICLIQLAVPGAEYIVDPLAGLDLAPLGEAMADPAIQKVFHAATQDIAGLKRDLGWHFANLFDTMWAARILGWEQLGLASILQEKFGAFSDKHFQRHNWGLRPLLPEALAYARMDVRYLLALRDLQQVDLRRAGREEEAAELFGDLVQTPPAVPAYGPESFWRVKGVYDLEEQDRAVLWELYLWRDGVAQRRSRPPFKVLSDTMLTVLAETRPHSLRQLAAVGLKDHQVQRYGKALLAAVARGEHGPVPHPQRRPRHDDAVLARYDALRTWRLRTATARGVSSDVILSGDSLWSLAERNPATLAEMEEIEDLGPWRRRTYGPAILRLLHPRAGEKGK